MKKVSKAILIVVAALFALGLALIVGLNLYVQSPRTQARIQEELSKTLRLPLKLTNTTITPWSDLRITGITIPNGDANFLEAASFSARYRLFPLFKGKLVIPEMRVENPRLVWRQNEEKKWKLPEPEKAAAVARAESTAPVAETTGEPAPSTSPREKPGKSKTATAPDETKSPAEITTAVPKEKQEKAAPAPKKSFVVIVERFVVQNGAVELLDHENKHVAVFTEVNMTYTKLTAEAVEGTASIGKATWADGLTLENVRTPFSFMPADHEFSLPEITATLAGGSLRGRYLSRSEMEHTPYNAALKFEGIDMDRLSIQLGGEKGQAVGELKGQVEVRGETDRPDKLTGAGVLDLRDGQFSQLELFLNIGQALGLRELSNLRVRDGHADFDISGEKIIVSNLALTTKDLQLTSKGTIRFDKKVALDSKLSVEEALARQLPSMIADSFVPAENNRRSIDFNITGTTDKLKTNLLDKLIGKKINAQFGDLISNLFGSDKNSDDDRKKEEERKRAEKKNGKDRKKKTPEKADSAPKADLETTIIPAPAPAAAPNL